MTNEEAYKIGFMTKCAELGLDPEEAALKFIKSGIWPAAWLGAGGLKGLKALGFGSLALAPPAAILAAGGFGEKALEQAGKLTGKALRWGIPLGLIAPPLAGLAIGHSLARTAAPKVDPRKFQRREKKEEYERSIALLKRNLRNRGVDV